MLKIEPQLQTEFHQRLATDEWQAKLTACIVDALASHHEYRTSNGSGVVRSRYNEERYMGPLSVVKYDFIVEAQIRRHRALTWRRDQYNAEVRWSPSIEKFEIKRETISTVETRAARRTEPCGCKPVYRTGSIWLWPGRGRSLYLPVVRRNDANSVFTALAQCLPLDATFRRALFHACGVDHAATVVAQ